MNKKKKIKKQLPNHKVEVNKNDLFYKMYKKEEHHLKKLYDTILLSEILKINYEYSNQIHYKITGRDAMAITMEKEKYSKEEIDDMIKNAILLLNIKYNYPIKNENILEQFNNLDFK